MIKSFGFLVSLVLIQMIRNLSGAEDTRLLREIEDALDPAGEGEEAQLPPRGKREDERAMKRTNFKPIYSI